MAEPPADGGDRYRAAPIVGLVAAVLPAVVMVIRAAAEGWVPLFDAAYFTVRSRDVATAHNPLVGAWSMGSREVGVWINNLGPLQLDLLAPFTKLDPYWGTALGVAALNVACIAVVWFVARRLLGPAGALGAMAATLLLELGEGSLMLIEARQQLAMILPMWALLWLAAAAWHGERWALPALAGVASLVLQTHFTYAYQTIVVSLAAVAVLIARHRRDPGRLLRPAVATAAVVAAGWAMPLWDQFAGTGNLGRVLDQGGGSARSVGLSHGLRILAETGFVPPFFVPGSMDDLLRHGARTSLAVAAVAMAVWIGLLVLAAVAPWRPATARCSPARALAGVAVAALAGSVLAVAKIPPTEQFGIIAQNYYWAWPVGIFASTALVAGAIDVLRASGGDRLRALPRRAGDLVALAVTAAVVAAAVALLGPTNRLSETAEEWRVARHQARPLLDRFGEALDDQPLAGPVLVDLGSSPYVRYTLLAELQRRDVDFRFAPGSTDLSRFGRERCDDGSATTVLSLHSGADAVRLDGGGDLLAAVAGLGGGGAERSAELARRFGDALRDGRVRITTDLVSPEEQARIDQVTATPGVSARGLAQTLANYDTLHLLEIPDDLRGDLAEWRQLEWDADDLRMAIYAEPIAAGRPDRCGEIAPGDEFLDQTTAPAAGY